MNILVDTNVLLRWINLDDPESPSAVAAVNALRDLGATMYVSPQNMIEFWSVATRPRTVNGFEMEPEMAEVELQRIERFFKLAPDIPTIFAEWRRLVVSCGVSGRQVHDARIAAVMRAHGIAHLLTFNTSDFQRYPGVTAVHPNDV